MPLHDGNSIIAVVVVPTIGGALGLLLLGPLGLIIGFALPLVIGANMDEPEDGSDERIAELERRVEELEDNPDT